jgi:hypothetical protein
MSVHLKIREFLDASKMPETKFGRLAVGDPRLIRDIRNGRELRARTIARIEAFLAEQRRAR